MIIKCFSNMHSIYSTWITQRPQKAPHKLKDLGLEAFSGDTHKIREPG